MKYNIAADPMPLFDILLRLIDPIMDDGEVSVALCHLWEFYQAAYREGYSQAIDDAVNTFGHIKPVYGHFLTGCHDIRTPDDKKCHD